jgi:large subunit ribosomal protein L10
LNKEEKVRIVSELQSKFEKAQGIVFTDFRGLNVEEITGLRNSLRESAVEYRVVKNTLARRAAEGTSVEAARDVFEGPVAIAVSYDDPVVVVKKILEFSKKNDKLEIKGGVIEGSACNVDQLKKIADLPSREVQLTMLVGAMQAPLRNLAGALNATVARFAFALEALRKQKEGGQ